MLSRGDAGRTSAGTAQHRGVQRRDRGGGSVDGTAGMVVAATQNGIVVPDERTATPVVRVLRALRQRMSVPLSELLETPSPPLARRSLVDLCFRQALRQQSGGVCQLGPPNRRRRTSALFHPIGVFPGPRWTSRPCYPYRTRESVGARSKMAISLSCRAFPS